MTEAARDRRAYDLAVEYSLRFRDQGITPKLLVEYQTPASRPQKMTGIYKRLLVSAQNRSRAPSVIGKAIGGINPHFHFEHLLVTS